MINGAINREAILSKGPTLRREQVDVPEWGGGVYVRELTAAEQLEVANADGDRASFDALLRAIVTEAGERIFTDEDESVLRNMGARSFNALMTVMGRLNGVSAEGNSEAIPGDGSPIA